MIFIRTQFLKFESEENITEYNKNFFIRKTTIKVPAVDEENNGLMVDLFVELLSKEKNIDIDNIIFLEDTRASIKIAKLVAQNITSKNLSEYNVIFSTKTNTSFIEGSSAGPAMAIAIISSLENRNLNSKVSITGKLDSNGNIGKVSAILEKAKAAKENDLELLIIPKGQSNEILYRKEIICDDTQTHCKTELVKKIINIEKETRLEIKEVGNIREALKYFFSP